MTWEEMMSPFLGVLADSGTDPKTVLKLKGQTVNGTGASRDRVPELCAKPASPVERPALLRDCGT